jgi:hypothetical protein
MVVFGLVSEDLALLRQLLEEIPDVRKARGKVHPLGAVLTLTVLGLMANCSSLSALSRFGKRHPALLLALSLRRSPSVATLSRLLSQVSVEAVREALFSFSRHLLARRAPAKEELVVAVDGKTLRGCHEDGQPLHVLHLFASELLLTLDQATAGSKEDERVALAGWLEEHEAELAARKIFTGDALFVSRSLCQAIIEAGGEYVCRLKQTNPPSTRPWLNSSPTRALP